MGRSQPHIPQDLVEVIGIWPSIEQGLHCRHVEGDQETNSASFDDHILFNEVCMEPGMMLHGDDDRARRANVRGQPPAPTPSWKSFGN